MRRFLVAGFVIALVMSPRADSQLIPLVDPSDPIVITNSMLEFVDDVRPVMTLELDNRTAAPVETRDIWVNRARFFTKAEAAADRKVWDCGLMSSAADDEKSTSIAPGQRVIVRLSLTQSCDYHRDHEHFFVEVTRIAHRFSEPSWKREASEFSRLLAAAQPHP